MGKGSIGTLEVCPCLSDLPQSELKILEGKAQNKNLKMATEWLPQFLLYHEGRQAAPAGWAAGGQLVVTPVSLCTHNPAWRAEASPALPLGPWCPEGHCGRQSHALLSGSLILSCPFLPSFSVQNTCIPSSMTMVWGPPPHSLKPTGPETK